MEGPLVAAEFKANAGGTADEPDDRVLYDTTTGDLYYDADGSGPGAALKFATLSNAPAIDADDFLVML